MSGRTPNDRSPPTTTEPLSTRERLVLLVAEHPDWTGRQYAQALGVSRVRVYQLLTKLHARQVWII